MTSHAPSSAVFFLAHQDDDYFVSPWIVDELRRGATLRFFYLTDGGNAIVRDRECLRFLRTLGVPSENVSFVKIRGARIGGGDLANLASETLAAVVGLTRDLALEPTRVYAPSYEGGHPDHDATHLIAAAFASRFGVLEESWQFSLYNAYGCARPFFNCLRQLPNAAAKRSIAMGLWKRLGLALACWRYYPSQFTTFVGLFPGAFLERVLLARENVVGFSIGRLSKRPHDGPLLYETRFGWTFERFAAATKTIVSHLTSDPRATE